MIHRAEELLHMRPSFPIHGSYSTVFSDGSLGENGKFLFLQVNTWAVGFKGSGYLLNHEDSSLRRSRQGVEVGPSIRPQNRAPWNLVFPSRAAIYGRENDDWNIEEAAELHAAADTGLITGNLVAKDGDASGEVLFDADMHVIRQIKVPAWTASLVVEKTFPAYLGGRLREFMENAA